MPGRHSLRRCRARKTKTRYVRPADERRNDREVADRDQHLARRNRRRRFVRGCIRRESEVPDEHPRGRAPISDTWPDRAEPAARQLDTESRAAGVLESQSTCEGRSRANERNPERAERDQSSGPPRHHMHCTAAASCRVQRHIDARQGTLLSTAHTSADSPEALELRKANSGRFQRLVQATHARASTGDGEHGVEASRDQLVRMLVSISRMRRRSTERISSEDAHEKRTRSCPRWRGR